MITINTTDTTACDLDCAHCEAKAKRRTCSRCGATGIYTDCGHQAQPRPIAAGRVDGSCGTKDFCSECAEITA